MKVTQTKTIHLSDEEIRKILISHVVKEPIVGTVKLSFSVDMINSDPPINAVIEYVTNQIETKAI